MSVSDRAYFYDNGYIVINNAFPLEDLFALQASLRNNIRRALDKYGLDLPMVSQRSLKEECDAGLIALRSLNPQYPSEVQGAVSRSPEYFRLCSSPTVMEAMRGLLGLSSGSPLYLTNNGVIFTNPNDSANKRSSNIEIGWHNDTFYTIPKSRFLQIWIPVLNDATDAIGTLQVCPGSHQVVMSKQTIHPEEQYDHRYQIGPEEVSKYNSVSVEVKLGAVLIFDGGLIHRSGINTSEHVRCTIIGMYHDASREDFYPLQIEYRYVSQTPEGYFYEVFGDEKAKSLMHEQGGSEADYN